jgi:hypothetical protein
MKNLEMKIVYSYDNDEWASDMYDTIQDAMQGALRHYPGKVLKEIWIGTIDETEAGRHTIKTPHHFTLVHVPYTGPVYKEVTIKC